jgi:hypothetical protein
MELWANEVAQAKQEGQRPTAKKPKLGKLEGAIPRPRANHEVEGTSDSESDGGSVEAS